MRIDAGTRLLALLGDPVEHSLSPRFQNAAIQAAGLHGIYLALRSSRAHLAALLRGIAHAGGGGNVTLPHKSAALRAVDHAAEAAVLTGACNTFWLENGKVLGDNTDVYGFRVAVERLMGDSPRSARVLLLGAGGAAHAAVVALEATGADSVEVWNRTLPRAERLVAEMGRAGRLTVLHQIPPRLESYDLIVNATSIGLGVNDAFPLDPERIHSSTRVLDLVYRPGGTRFVRALRARGIVADDGTEMLIQQGAASFERWWEQPAPIEAMRRALADPMDPDQ